MPNDRSYRGNRFENLDNTSPNQQNTRPKLSLRERNLVFTSHGNSTLAENVAQFETITKREAYQREELKRPPTPGTERDTFILNPPLLQSQQDRSYFTQTSINSPLDQQSIILETTSNPTNNSESIHNKAVNREIESLENLQDNQRIFFGEWSITPQEINHRLNKFISIFDQIRNKEIAPKDIDSSIHELATSGARTLKKFITLAENYLPQDRDAQSLKNLVSDILLNNGRLPDQKERSAYTFSESERTLITQWMIPFTTKGMDTDDRLKINAVFGNRTERQRKQNSIRNKNIYDKKKSHG